LREGANLDSTRRGTSDWSSIVSRFTAAVALRWRLDGRGEGFFLWGISGPPAAFGPHVGRRRDASPAGSPWNPAILNDRAVGSAGALLGA
jgi:hypothetical protein